MHPVNRLLNVFGLTLVRVPPPRRRDSRVSVLHLGGHHIKAPTEGSLYRSYTQSPLYNSQIGRIAAAAYCRYPGMIAVDVGANVGDTAAILRGSCPAPIICIEGDPDVGKILADNVAQFGDVRIVQSFLGERRDVLRVNVAKQGWNSTLIFAENGASGIDLPFATLDEVIKEDERERIKLIKIDTEGHESRVLRGGRRTLREARPAVLFEHNREALAATGADGTEIFHELKELGYRSILFWNAAGRFFLGTTLDEMEMIEDLHEFVAFEGKSLGGIYYLDVCAFHGDDNELAEQCLAVERGVVRDRKLAGAR